MKLLESYDVPIYGIHKVYFVKNYKVKRIGVNFII